MMKFVRIPVLFILLLHILGINEASAQIRVDIQEMLKRSDFVFEGTVIDVQNRFSSRLDPKDPSPQPHTFVVYKVQSVFKGNYGSSTLSLRFFGGPINEEEYVNAPAFPSFDVGDHDLLLVFGNNHELCPLVDCSAGRFRYIRNIVVNEYGETIEFDENGAIALGKKVDLDEVKTHKISDTLSTKRVEVLEEGELSEYRQLDEVDKNTTLDPSSFSVYMQDNVYASHTREELATASNFETADPDKPFGVESFRNRIRASDILNQPNSGEEEVLGNAEEREVRAVMTSGHNKNVDDNSDDSEKSNNTQSVSLKGISIFTLGFLLCFLSMSAFGCRRLYIIFRNGT